MRAASVEMSAMHALLERSLLAFIPVFVAIDPIGLIALFMGLAPNAPREVRQRQGMLGIATGFAVSIGFIFLGKFIFSALGITVSDFQVAGGLILLGLAGRELIGGEERARCPSEEFGVVPLGMPLIAGPALLTALLILVDTVGVVLTIGSLVVNLLLVEVGFRYARRVEALMSRQGLNGASKLIALLLAAIAISLIRRGWQAR
ncbi:MAG TPA: MarC family protein [Chthoniobacterales bacterium]|jgi:multiple antibiotic resistance protein